MNSAPIDLAFCLGLGYAGEQIEESVGGVHVNEVRVKLVAEHIDDLLGFALAHETVVHMHADELLADGLDQKGGHHGGVDAAGKGEQNLLVADLRFGFGNLLIDECLGQFGGGDAYHVVRALVGIHASFLSIRVHGLCAAFCSQIALCRP